MSVCCCSSGPTGSHVKVESVATDAAREEAAREAKREMVVTFEDREGVEDEKLPGAKIDLAFKQRPVGFKFRLRTPMSVLSVAPGSHAEELGVKQGMILVAVNGERVDAMSPRQAYWLLQVGSEKLEPRPAEGKETAVAVTTSDELHTSAPGEPNT
mmetsp:Transcript_35595/g.101378  ORF Transcript_35595/g.101378 Transcript_35595/m.101378 type:complete len:156 (+) Transcript_35595:85-552(+)